MKNKIITFLIIIALCISVVCLRPMYGVPRSIYIAFFVGSLLFFIKGFIQFVLKKQGGLIAYVFMLYNNLKGFINTQAREYNTIAWYKKPKYWLLFILLILHVATKFYYGHPDITNVLFQCAYATPILLFIFIGRAFPFAILLLIYGLYYLMGTTIRFSEMHLQGILITICWLWFMVSIMGLMTTCWLIEIKRKKHPLWKQFLKGFAMCVLWVAYCLGVFYIQDKVSNHIISKTIATNYCIKHNYTPGMDTDSLNKLCVEASKNWLQLIKKYGAYKVSYVESTYKNNVALEELCYPIWSKAAKESKYYTYEQIAESFYDLFAETDTGKELQIPKELFVEFDKKLGPQILKGEKKFLENTSKESEYTISKEKYGVICQEVLKRFHDKVREQKTKK